MESNAWKDLQAGFTTVQTLGANSEKIVRDVIDRGDVPGAKILTSLHRSRTHRSPSIRFASAFAR